MSKIYAFDYMLSLFENWYNEENKEQNKGFENCSKLSMLKLLFLTAVPKEEGARDLLDIFDNFHALPYTLWKVIYIMLFKIKNCHLIL